jgi:hypothetical protein
MIGVSVACGSVFPPSLKLRRTGRLRLWHSVFRWPAAQCFGASVKRERIVRSDWLFQCFGGLRLSVSVRR